MDTSLATHKWLLVAMEEGIFEQFPTETKMEQNEKKSLCLWYCSSKTQQYKGNQWQLVFYVISAILDKGVLVRAVTVILVGTRTIEAKRNLVRLILKLVVLVPNERLKFSEGIQPSLGQSAQPSLGQVATNHLQGSQMKERCNNLQSHSIWFSWVELNKGHII